jgi:hypothetical protein
VQSTNNAWTVNAGDNGLNSDTYLIPQNPSAGGLGLGTIDFPFKWIDVTSAFVLGNLVLGNGNAIASLSVGYTAPYSYILPSNTTTALGSINYPFAYIDTAAVLTTVIQNYQSGNPAINVNSPLTLNSSINFNGQSVSGLSVPHTVISDWSTWFNQYLTTSSDAIFNSVLGTYGGAAIKAGDYGGNTYFVVSWD